MCRKCAYSTVSADRLLSVGGKCVIVKDAGGPVCGDSIYLLDFTAVVVDYDIVKTIYIYIYKFF